MSTGPTVRTQLKAGDFRRYALELSRATTPPEVVDVVSRHGRVLFGAARAAVVTPSNHEDRLDLVATELLDDGLRHGAAQLDIGSELPLVAAFRTGRIQVQDGPAPSRIDFPSLRPEDPPAEASLASPLWAGERVIGAIGFSFDIPRTFGASELELLDAVASLAAIVLERARLFEESRKEASYQRFLARASEQMSASIEADEILSRVATLAVPTFADGVAVDRFEEGSVRRVALHHGDPEWLEAARALSSRYPLSPEEVESLRQRGPRMISEITDPLLVAHARDPGHLAALRALSMRSWIAAPILVRGQVYGTFTFVRVESGRRFGSQELAIAADLARRVGAAVENVLLCEEVRSAEREVAEAQRVVARISDASPDLLLVVELPSARVLYINRGEGEVFGHSIEALRALDPRSLVHPEDLDRVTLELSRIPSLGDGELIEHRYRVRHADGGFRWVDVRSAVFARDPEGRPCQLLSVARDVTEQVRATQALEEADRRKDEFLALVGHELRNPLAAIRNAADLLQRTRTDGRSSIQACEVIVRQVGHMGRMLGDLLDLSRMTEDKLLIRAEPLDASALVRQIVEEQRPELERGGVSIALRSEGPVFVLGDPTRLSQVFSILLHNAGKFTDPGGQVTVAVDSTPEQAVIGISDSGIGIEPEKLVQLFSPFVQGERRLDSSTGGLGLGLALVKGLVERHSGRVRAASAGLGCGATFTVTLPRIAPPESVDAGLQAPSEVSRRILIVEDNEDAATMLKMLLEFGGHAVELALDGQAALEKARRFDPEVVLCDIGLPGALDGYGVARALRAGEKGERVFLVALTGYGQLEDQQRAMEAGFDRHVTKPIDPGELERLIAQGRQRITTGSAEPSP